MANVLEPSEVYDIINELGTDATVETVASETYDPTTMLVTSGTATDNAVRVSPPFSLSRYSDGSHVAENTQVIYFANYNLDFTPKLGLKLTVDSVVWYITVLNQYDVGDDIGLWEAGITK